MLGIFTRKGPPQRGLPIELSAYSDGSAADWDVDDYEHMYPTDLRLRDPWQRTLEVGGLPEMWLEIEPQKKTFFAKLFQRLGRWKRIEPRGSTAELRSGDSRGGCPYMRHFTSPSLPVFTS